MSSVNYTIASRRERSLFFNTLSSLVKNIEGKYTTVDLRNECCVTGKIVKVDGYMNIEMEDVVFYDMRSSQKFLESFYICARNIRNVHMPKNADAVTLLRNHFDSMVRKTSSKPKKEFKVSRAEKKNMETIREAYEGK